MSRVDPTGPLENVNVVTNTEKAFVAWANCPGCGLRARIDRDQYRGDVSVDCPECGYHETHDHREEDRTDDPT